MHQLRRKIRIRERLPIWGLRLVLGMILFTLSELVMWQNPPARPLAEWPVLLLLYICLAAIFMDIVVRFQANDLASMVLASGIYGLSSAAIINHSAFDNLAAGPYGLLGRGLGLQTAAGLYGLLLYVVVMRGKPPEVLHLVGALAIGILWGVWVHWYPLQSVANWGLVTIEQATPYLLIPLVILGLLLTCVVPGFRFFREKQLELLWWEAILFGLPLFIALLVGMLQNIIPFLPLVVLVAVGAFIIWVLSYQREGSSEPSILAHVVFAAPNPITYLILAIAFFLAGAAAYSLVDGKDSIVGIAVYWLVLFFGTFALPAAVLLIFWRVFRAQTSPVKDWSDEEEA